MNRLSLIAATAVIALALVGGAVFVMSGSKGPAQPTAAPTASPVATVAPSIIPTSPEALQSWWVANAPTGSAGAVLTLEIQPNLITVRDAGTESVWSSGAQHR